jgi:transcriptional regulator
MHVDRDNLSAKMWLDPDIRLAENLGYSRQELRVIERLARENLEKLRNEWDNFCREAANST